MVSQSQSGSPASRLLSQSETERILTHLIARLSTQGSTELAVSSYWQGELRWARNRATLTSDRRDIRVIVFRNIRGGTSSALTNQIDDVSLENVVRIAEEQALAHARGTPNDMAMPRYEPPRLDATIWSDQTFARTAEESAKLVQRATQQAEAKQMLSAGYLETRGWSLGTQTIDMWGRRESYYSRLTQAQCSATVRHPKGTGSGWAGLSGYDIAKIDEEAIAARALEKCLASLDPVRIEPGRYTVVLEPQAVAAMVRLMLTYPMNRPATERGLVKTFLLGTDNAVRRNLTKLALRVVDERITISHDPSDPALGIPPIPGIRPITWIQNGILQEMNYGRLHALGELNANEMNEPRLSFRMSGGTTSIEEMIETTKRGLLVTRLVPQVNLHQESVLYSGVTRDGLWLIENGKISKAVRNFRFTESPLFILNNVVDLGVPVPVFQPTDSPEDLYKSPSFALTQTVIPPIKANDFSFTSTIDAV